MPNATSVPVAGWYFRNLLLRKKMQQSTFYPRRGFRASINRPGLLHAMFAHDFRAREASLLRFTLAPVRPL